MEGWLDEGVWKDDWMKICIMEGWLDEGMYRRVVG